MNTKQQNKEENKKLEMVANLLAKKAIHGDLTAKAALQLLIKKTPSLASKIRKLINQKVLP